MTSDPDNLKPDAEPQKEPWQVVGCPTCRAPPGMRCSSGRMTTHSTRKRVFFKKWEEEQVRLGKGRMVNGKFEFYTRKKPTFPVEKPSKAEKSATPPGQLARAPRKPRAKPTARGTAQTAQAVQAAAEKNGPKAGRSFLPGGEDDWSALAAQLRADNKRASPPASSSPSPSPSPAPNPRVPSALAAPKTAIKPPAPPQLDPSQAKAGLNPQPPASSQTAPAFNLTLKRENPAVWKDTLCPQCRAPAGVRCVGPLGDARFASHEARQKLHAAQDTSGKG